MYSLMTAAQGAITDWSDVGSRGHLKEHPDVVTYRLDLLTGMIAQLRQQVTKEEARWRRDDVANNWPPPNAQAQHAEAVAEFMTHTGCCPHCLICQGHDDIFADDPFDQEE